MSDSPLGPLNVTSVKTGGYSPKAGEFVLCDVSSSSITVTLPGNPRVNHAISVKLLATSGGNSVTVARNEQHH